MFRFAVGVIAVATLIASGCGGSSPDSAPITTNDMLSDLKDVVTQFQQDKKRPPARLSDLAPYEPEHPAGIRGLSMDTCTYFWGQGLGDGTAILAYENKAKTEGGAVLLENGEVKTMTAAEFAAAPKASKK